MPNTLITMHQIALLKVFIFRICPVRAKHLNILLQIPALVFIHDREQEEELLIHTLL